MFDPLNIFEALGGLALFLYGIKFVSKSLEDLAGASLKLIISRLTKSRLSCYFLGFATAVSFQSSGAVMLILVGFINAALLTLPEALSVTIGAGLGSTITVQLIAFKLTRFALLLVFLGFLPMKFWHSEKTRNAGKVIFAFGLIFLGMRLMMESFNHIQDSTAIHQFVQFLSAQPFWTLILGFLLTGLFQSSAAAIGIILTLSFQNLISFPAAFPFILGANIGSCLTGFIGSIGARVKGRRIIWAEFFMRTITAIILFIFRNPISELFGIWGIACGLSEARLIAMGHTFFSLITTLIFLPLTKPIATMVKNAFPDRHEEKFGALYLDFNVLDNPPMALGQAAREVIRMGDLVNDMFEKMMELIRRNEKEMLDDLIKKDDEIDLLQEEITRFLSRLSRQELDTEESQKSIELVNIAVHLEHIADILCKNITQYARKRIEYGYYFSHEGYKEVEYLSRETQKNLQMALNCIPMRDKKSALQVIEGTKHLVGEQRKLYRSHLERLNKGLRESLETSTIHLDLLSDLNHINLLCSYIAYAILGKV